MLMWDGKGGGVDVGIPVGRGAALPPSPRASQFLPVAPSSPPRPEVTSLRPRGSGCFRVEEAPAKAPGVERVLGGSQALGGCHDEPGGPGGHPRS